MICFQTAKLLILYEKTIKIDVFFELSLLLL